ncbi:MAG: ABC transporter ATP-binding protein [Lactobacillales bacterium]|nr:ABC transporter ATP-binding protein [Lactobacillales bacterium]
MLYRLEKVSKIYKNSNTENHALNKVDLEINEGEIVVILGPSGSGKSTMLNILSGIDNPSKGKVYFNEQRIDKLNENELTNYRKDNLGFIFQSYNLVSNLTIKENIELGKELSTNPLSIKEMIKEVGLEKHKNKYPYQLSGGQMQRVAIARAIVKNPKVLFCDEPTGALDEETGKNVLKLLQDLNKKHNTTMIIVTHNPSIANMAHTVIKMNSGEIKEIIKNKKIMSAEDLRWA